MEFRNVHGRRHQVCPMRVFAPNTGLRESFGVRLFYALGLDLTPRVWGVVCGRWWLCGHEPLRAPEENALRDELPAYFPAVFSSATARYGKNESTVSTMEARCYAQNHGILEDIRIWHAAFTGRWRFISGGERNR